MTAPVFLNSLGIVCALGAGADEVSGRLFGADATGIRRLKNAVVGGQALPFGAVTGALPPIPVGLSRYASRNVALMLAALAQIEDPVARAIARFGGDRVAVVMGSSTSGIHVGESALATAGFRDSCAFPPGYDFLQQEIGSVAESVAAYYGLATPAMTISTACSSSAKALATARRMLRQGLADAVIAGGCDSHCALTLNGFHALSALSAHACRPFSAARDGTVIGEGAAVFLMSREPPGPFLAGVGESSDAYNMTAPDPEGRGASAAMRAALLDADLDAASISYVNLHGTATELNDAMESRALREVFPQGVACSSSKGQLGHTLGAAGAIEAAVCWLTLASNPGHLLPPHVWDGAEDPEAHLPGLVGPGARLPAADRHYLMSNSYAFGGSNVALILGSGP